MTQPKSTNLLFQVGMLISCILLGFSLSAQTIQWEKSYGGTHSEYDNNIALTADGGYIMAGATTSKDHDVSLSYGGADFWIVKLDALGSIQWEKTYGGTDPDVPGDVRQTTDGGYIIVGYSLSDDIDVSGNYGKEDIWVIKLDGAGNLEWEKNYGGSGYDYPNAVVQTSDGGYLIAGSTTSIDHDVSAIYGGDDCWLVKLDSSGSIEWEKNYGGTGYEYAQSIQLTSDGGYVMLGRSNSDDIDVSGNNGGQDYWLVKLDNNGNIQWDANYGGSSSDWGWFVQQTMDKGYVLVGDSRSNDHDVSGNNGEDDYWVVKVDSMGGIEWEQNYGGSSYDWGRSVLQTPDGGYVISGGSNSDDLDVSGNYGNNDYWILRLDQSGNIVWEQNYGGSNNDAAAAMVFAPDGDVLVAGGSSSTDQDISGGYADSLGATDLWVVKIGITTGIVEENTNPAISLYPNPTEGPLSIDLGAHYSSAEALISNALGQVIQRSTFYNSQMLDLEITGSAGIYFIQIKTDNDRTATFSMVKE